MVTFSGCKKVPSEEEHLLKLAESIHRFPIQRSALLKGLDLSELSSGGLNLGIRSGNALISETWHHRSGLTVTAYHSEFVGGGVVFTRGSIDEILKNQESKPTAPRGQADGVVWPETFNGFSINKGDKVLYRSDQNQEGEQD
jgi:hypothetical protein